MPSYVSISLLGSKLPLLLHSHHLKTTRQLFSSSCSLLHSCKDLKTLRKIHALLIVSGGFNHGSVASKLLSLYSHLHDPETAISVFNSLKEPPGDTLAWNLFMKTHVDSGLLIETLFLYKEMRKLGIKADSFTFPIINRAVLSLRGDVELGEMVHCAAAKMGFTFDVYFCNTMIEVYAKCWSVVDARKVFDDMFHRDLVSWTSMISGYVFEGNISAVFELFNRMRVEMEPNSVTMIIMLQGCYVCESLTEGRQLHGYVIKNCLLTDRSVQNSVLRIYIRMGCVEEVEDLFFKFDRRDAVSWNSVINFYALRGEVEKVFGSFNNMQGEVALSSETLTSVVSVLAKVGGLMKGKKLHSIAIKVGLCDDVLLTALLDFYAKCGELRDSALLFEEIHFKSSISWNAMMTGFIQNGHFSEAIGFFHGMQASVHELGAEILGSLVDACTHLGAVQLGKRIHGYVIRNLSHKAEEDTMHLQTSILNMYAKCGNFPLAKKCFDMMINKDIVAWTSMLEGYGIHGLGYEVLNLFHRMLEEGITPNRVTFLSLLSSCSHSGLVREGCEMFASMKWIFGVEPDVDHYTCIVDLLGRSGKVKEALAIVMKMVVLADNRIWGALLAASRVHGDDKIGEFAANKVLEMGPDTDSAGYYTLLSNVQASIGKWDEVEQVRRVMHEKDLKKEPGGSFIEQKISSNVKSRTQDFILTNLYEVL